MTRAIPQDHVALTGERSACLGLNDPLLQELWATKATPNAAAGFSVAKLAEQARQFDLDAALIRLRQQSNH